MYIIWETRKILGVYVVVGITWTFISSESRKKYEVSSVSKRHMRWASFVDAWDVSEDIYIEILDSRGNTKHQDYWFCIELFVLRYKSLGRDEM